MKKSRLIFFLIFGFLVGYLLNRAVALYFLSPGASSVDKFQKAVTSLGTSLQTQPFAFSFSLYPFLAFLGGLLLLMIFYLLSLNDKTYMAGKEHGSDRWATHKDIEVFADKHPDKNLLLSKNARLTMETKKLPFELQRNHNVLVIGGSGAGKTFFYLKPNISQLYSAYVITDPKGTVIRETGQMMEDKGYKVKCFDIFTMKNSDSFNPFAYIHDEITLKRIIQVVIDATNGDHARKGEPFWDKSEELLLGALFSYLYYVYNGEGDVAGSGEMPALYDISDMIRSLERKDDDTPSYLEQAFDDFETEFGSDNYAVLQFKSFKNYKGDTRSSVLAIATARFSMFDLKQVRNMLRQDTLEIDQWATEKFAVYLPIPSIDKTFNFLTTMIFVLAMRTLEYQAEVVYHGSLPVQVSFMLDEFANLGLIPNMVELLSVVRSWNVSIAMLIQAMAQLKKLYPKDWEAMYANCDSIVYLSGGTEKTTAEFLTMRGGKSTIYEKKISETRGNSGSSNISDNSTGREVIMTGEVFTLPRDECLVAIASVPLYKDKKYNPHNHPRFKDWSSDPTDGKWYDYHKFFSEEEEYDYNVVKNHIPVEKIEIDLDEVLGMP